MEAQAGASFPIRFDLLGPNGEVLHTSEFVKEKIVIGRILSADLRIDDPVVSRIHALVEVRGDVVLLTDLASTHGTFVNGNKVVEARIRPGDVVKLGKIELRLEKGSGRVTSTQPFGDRPQYDSSETALDLDRSLIDQMDRRAPSQDRRRRDAFPEERRLDERRQGDRRIDQRSGNERRVEDVGVSVGTGGMVSTERRSGEERRVPLDFERRVGERRQGDRRIFDITSLERRIEDRRNRRFDDEPLPEELENAFETPAHPRELEVTCLWGDYILDISNFYEPRTLSVGESPINDYIIPSVGIPDEFPLIEIEEDANAYLAFTDEMSGTVRAREKIYTLEKLKDEKFVKKRGDSYVLQLKQDDFAKLTIGDINFFILYVKPAPRIKRAPLFERDPLILRSFIGSAIFLLLFGLASSFAPKEKPVTIEQIPERYAKIIVKKKPEIKKVEKKPETTPTLVPTPPPKMAKEDKKAPSQRERKVINEQKARASGLLKAFSNNAGLKNMLDSSPFAAPSFTGFGSASPGGKPVLGAVTGVKGVNVGAGSGTIGIEGPNTFGLAKGFGGLGGLGGGTGGTGRLGGKAEHAVQLVSENVQVLSGLPKDLINAVVQRNRAQIRACYDAALQRNPNLRGKVTVAFTIDPNGRVTYAGVKESTIGDSGLENCIIARVKSWQFPKPEAPVVTEVSAYPFYLNPAN
jgi:TonB family protein